MAGEGCLYGTVERGYGTSGLGLLMCAYGGSAGKAGLQPGSRLRGREEGVNWNIDGKAGGVLRGTIISYRKNEVPEFLCEEGAEQSRKSKGLHNVLGFHFLSNLITAIAWAPTINCPSTANQRNKRLKYLKHPLDLIILYGWPYGQTSDIMRSRKAIKVIANGATCNLPEARHSPLRDAAVATAIPSIAFMEIIALLISTASAHRTSRRLLG